MNVTLPPGRCAIADAPRDNTRLLLRMSDGYTTHVRVGGWDAERNVWKLEKTFDDITSYKTFKPTHYMKLPATEAWTVELLPRKDSP